jgi:hypothetical protein
MKNISLFEGTFQPSFANSSGSFDLSLMVIFLIIKMKPYAEYSIEPERV